MPDARYDKFFTFPLDLDLDLFSTNGHEAINLYQAQKSFVPFELNL